MAINPLKLVISEGQFEIINEFTGRPIFLQTSHPNNETWDAEAISQMGNEVFNQYLNNAKQEVFHTIAAKRDEFESGGTKFEGITIKTDPESQAKVNSTYTLIRDGLANNIDWKGVDGWVLLTTENVVGLVSAVSFHVQYSFSNEKRQREALTLIDNFTDLIAFDASKGFSLAEEEAALEAYMASLQPAE